jgi:HK97 family phage prohead protease
MRDRIEFKSFRLDVKDAGEAGEFTGHVSVFGNEDLDGDVIDPGAFLKTVSEHAGVFPMLWQHDTWEPIGVSKSMAEDSYGLATEGAFNMETQRGREAFSLLKQGALQGFSIGFKSIKDEPVGKYGRRFKELKLYEFSVVTFPANPLAVPTALKTADLLRLSGRVKAEDRDEFARAVNTLTALLPAEPDDESTQTKDAADPAGEPDYLSTLRDWMNVNFNREGRQ